MLCDIAHFGYKGATVCILIHRELSAQKSLPFTPVLIIRIIRAIPLPRRLCRVSIAEMQTCLQALSLLTAYNTLGLQSAPTFPVITQKKYFESRILHILLTSAIHNAEVGLI